jgi:hypothetical protein
MKYYLNLFFIIISFQILGAESHLTDIRFGSYNNKELILSKNKNANKTRFIFESDKKLVYITKFENNKFFIEITNCTHIPKSGKFKIYNGLVSELLFNNIKNNLSIIIKFEGTYEKSKVFAVKDPDRLIIDLYGKPKIDYIKKRNQSGKQIYKPITKTKITFKNSEKLYLNLNDVPIRNIIKFFSDSCKDDIIADNSVRGKASLSIKNQKLQTAFNLFLLSENLQLINKDGIFLIRKSNLNSNSSNSILIKYADPQNICQLLNRSFSTDDFIVDNLNHSILIPQNVDINKINNLITKYDNLILKKVNFISGFMSSKDFHKFYNPQNNHNLIDKSKVPFIRYKNKIVLNLYSSTINHINFSKNKFIKSGLIFSSKISALSGPDIFLTYFGKKDIFSEIKINWNILTDKYSRSFVDKLFIDNCNDKIIIIWNKLFLDKIKFDNWNFDRINYSDSEKIIPVIMIEFENSEK